MKVPLDWLKEFVAIPWSDEKVADRLVRLGVGVESKEKKLFDLEITANRGDLLSILGIAREIRALTGASIAYPQQMALPKRDAKLVPTMSDPSLVPRYTSAQITGIRVKPTKNPIIIKRLKQVGMRPVNNVVDVTNFVMFELGQPSHAFDWGKIHGDVMHIRPAKSGESLVTLDGIERELPEEALIIEDKERIIDLAGIMGGENSSIDDETTNLLLQAAIFDPVVIRRASKSLKLTSEASYRYERGVDEAGTKIALERLIALLTEEAGGKVTGVIDIDTTAPKRPITLPLATIKQVIGQPYPVGEVWEILERLGCVMKESGEELLVTPPTWRHDLVIAEDLVEEVARVKDYRQIGRRALLVRQASEATDWETRESLRDWLVERGLSEVMTYSLISPLDLTTTDTPPREAVRVANPLSPELQFFRPSLLPGLLKAAAKNPTTDPITIFELGRVATSKEEKWQIGILFAGKQAGEIRRITEPLGIIADKVTDELLSRYKIRKKDTFVALASWEQIAARVERVSELKMPDRFTVRSISKYPPVTRDISIVLSSDVRNDEIKMAIAAVSEYIHLVELFDEYQDDKLGQGNKSLAFHIMYQDPGKTLTSKEVLSLHRAVEKELVNKFHATIR